MNDETETTAWHSVKAMWHWLGDNFERRVLTMGQIVMFGVFLWSVF